MTAPAAGTALPADVQQALDKADAMFLARQYYDALDAYRRLLATADVNPQTGGSTGDPVRVKLASFTLLLRLGDCNVAIGRWQMAQTNYRTAAGFHGALDPVADVAGFWTRFAHLYVAWGDSLYLAGQPDAASPLYATVVTADGSAPTNELYTRPLLASASAVAVSVIAKLPAIIAQPTEIPTDINATIAAPIVDAYTKLGQIAAKLHFYGYSPVSVPVWTFEYLQQVAVQYCQFAVNTEQSVINFWDRADQAQLTMLQLQQHVADSAAAINAAQDQLGLADAETTVYQDALQLASRRAADAQASASSYRQKQPQVVLYNAVAAQVAGGADADPDRITALADQYTAEQTISGSRGDQAAALQLASGRLSQQYEVDALDRSTLEMQAAAQQAQDDLAVAQARTAAARGGVVLAQLQTAQAVTQVDALSTATFTATDWKAAGDQLYVVYRRYLAAAVRAARLMQQAYNFETDAASDVIRDDYTMNEMRSLLAADLLMADVNSFTDMVLSDRRGKTQPITHTISLAQRQSYLFETQFRRTGVIEFDTTADDFDLAYPGTYGGRIRHVEVTLEGLVPSSGVSGTLTNAGVSVYRLPSDRWSDQTPDGMRRRIQPSETLVLSDYSRSADTFGSAADVRQSGVFEGAGVIGTWRLEVPPEVNDLDYNLITDVLLTFTYEARFDYQLMGKVKQLLDNRPGAHVTQLGLPLRWLYPDTFFDLAAMGTATLHLSSSDLPLNHGQATLTQLAVLVTARPGQSPAGLTVTVTTPGSAPGAGAATDADGLASSAADQSPLVGQLGRPVVGDWTLTLVPAAPAADLAGVANVSLLLEYRYTPRTLS